MARPKKDDPARGKNSGAWCLVFLNEFRTNGGNFSLACDAAKISRQGAYDEIKKNPGFAQAVDDAKKALVDKVRKSALSRAADGYEKPVFQDGVQIGTQTVYETALTMFVLQKLDPDFGDKANNGAPIEPQRLQIEIIQSDPERENKIRDALKKTE